MVEMAAMVVFLLSKHVLPTGHFVYLFSNHHHFCFTEKQNREPRNKAFTLLNCKADIQIKVCLVTKASFSILVFSRSHCFCLHDMTLARLWQLKEEQEGSLLFAFPPQSRVKMYWIRLQRDSGTQVEDERDGLICEMVWGENIPQLQETVGDATDIEPKWRSESIKGRADELDPRSLQWKARNASPMKQAVLFPWSPLNTSVLHGCG